MSIARSALAATAALALLVPVAGCSTPSSATTDGRLRVVTSFYPIMFAVQQIGGDHVAVSSLTRPGIEPHDLELTPKQVTSMAFAGLVVYARGFQPAVDSAVEQAPKGTVLDVAPAADLSLSLDKITTVGSSGSQAGQEGGTDPHFWLDPVRYSAVGADIANRLIKADPAHRTDYVAGLHRFQAELRTLRQQFTTGLKSCSNTTIVTSHAAFGYFAERFGFKQAGVLGITPDQEPTPGRLQEVAAYVKEHHVTTIYAETLASPAVANAVANETGAKVAVLDPIEGVTSASAAKDYFGIMRADLATLRQGQGCH